MSRILLVAAMLAAAVLGRVFEDRHYRLAEAGRPSDQHPLAHRDSAYTSSTWVASRSENFLELRFFERVEGGVCLHPSWAELVGLRRDDGTPLLPHLDPGSPLAPRGALDPLWPASMPHPDPGTINSSPYISFFPAGVLLNRRVMAAAGDDPAGAAPRILIVGLGSGVGSAHLAHHFPQAAITVVDIDAVVRDIVLDHYPLIRWLTDQRTAAGDARLELVVEDARRWIRYDGARRRAAGKGFDVIILDAYTAGSTIPPHLMTREFFALCADALAEDGVVLANFIGSYGIPSAEGLRGPMHRALGGALRSMRAGGLPELWCIPVLNRQGETPGSFSALRDQSRNNIVVAGRAPVDPVGNRAGWERLERHVAFPGLATGRWRHAVWAVAGADNRMSSSVPDALVAQALPGLLRETTPYAFAADAARHLTRSDLAAGRIDELRRAVLAAAPGAGLRLTGWDRPATMAWRMEIDAVLRPREILRISIRNARDGTVHSGASLVGPIDPPGGARPDGPATWAISDAPLFTDQNPNADILNR
jgi:hypothetical protein